MTTHRVVFLPGDGIDPKATAAARRVVDATDVDVEAAMRLGAFDATGDALPADTVDAIVAALPLVSVD